MQEITPTSAFLTPTYNIAELTLLNNELGGANNLPMINWFLQNYLVNEALFSANMGFSFSSSLI